jgi:hypothetical protein
VVGIEGHALFNQQAIQPGPSSTFSLHNASRWIGPYLTELFSARFLVLAVLAAIGLTQVRRFRQSVIVPAIIFVYIATFVSFSQSYYADVLGQIPTFHFDRYTLQIAPLLAALGGLALTRIGTLSSGLRPRLVAVAAGATVAAVIVSGVTLGKRDRFSLRHDEQQVRLAPTQALCQATPAGSWIITSQPILVQVYCDHPPDVVDAAVIDAISPEFLFNLRDQGRLYHWTGDADAPVEVVRYAGLRALLARSVQAPVWHYESGGDASR